LVGWPSRFREPHPEMGICLRGCLACDGRIKKRNKVREERRESYINKIGLKCPNQPGREVQLSHSTERWSREKGEINANTDLTIITSPTGSTSIRDLCTGETVLN
jgi:hypothetical protein